MDRRTFLTSSIAVAAASAIPVASALPSAAAFEAVFGGGGIGGPGPGWIIRNAVTGERVGFVQRAGVGSWFRDENFVAIQIGRDELDVVPRYAHRIMLAERVGF